MSGAHPEDRAVVGAWVVGVLLGDSLVVAIVQDSDRAVAGRIEGRIVMTRIEVVEVRCCIVEGLGCRIVAFVFRQGLPG